MYKILEKNVQGEVNLLRKFKIYQFQLSNYFDCFGVMLLLIFFYCSGRPWLY